MRSSSYQEKVRAIFRELGGYYPRKVRCVDVGFDKGEDDVFKLVQHILSEEFGAIEEWTAPK
jgi:thymidylate kinase